MMKLRMFLCFIFGHNWEWSNYRVWPDIDVADAECKRCDARHKRFGFSSMAEEQR